MNQWLVCFDPLHCVFFHKRCILVTIPYVNWTQFMQWIIQLSSTQFAWNVWNLLKYLPKTVLIYCKNAKSFNKNFSIYDTTHFTSYGAVPSAEWWYLVDVGQSKHSGRKTHSTRDLVIARESNKTALLRTTKWIKVMTKRSQSLWRPWFKTQVSFEQYCKYFVISQFA